MPLIKRVERRMKVEIFSDVVCPWCAIGKRRFERAVEGFAHKSELEVTWRAFKLDPSAPAHAEGDMAVHLAQKYGMTLDEARASQSRLSAMASVEGLEFHFERTRRANTFDAHRLLHFAFDVGVQDALKERLFRAYFTEGASIGDTDTLVRLGEEVGLDGPKCAEILQNGTYGEEVRGDEADARRLGISGVPFFVIDRQYGISGAQRPETILQALNETWSRSHGLSTLIGDGTACYDEHCEIPP
jgi:predicted DsbA family dithiol-disulfide isomerase